MTALQQTKLHTEIVVQTPWSSVVRINTGDELFYLQTTPTLIALEADIIKILHDQFRAPVPTVGQDYPLNSKPSSALLARNTNQGFAAMVIQGAQQSERRDCE